MFAPLQRAWDAPRLPSSSLIDNRYRLGRKLGAGAFAKVYEARDLSSHELLAVKLERASKPYPSLPTEYAVYSKLARSRAHVPGIPRMRHYGSHGPYHALVLDCLGQSLATVVDKRKLTFSVKSVLMLGIQTLTILEHLHGHGFLHRDIKPDNMMPGKHDPQQVYLADYGLAGQYRDQWNRHIPPMANVGTVGTVEFSSLNSMHGRELSRRDDLESLGYTLVFLFKGELPWTSVRAHGMQALQRKVTEVKERCSIRKLCQGLPDEIVYFFQYVAKLGFDQAPDYQHLRSVLRNALRTRGYREDYVYEEWMSAFSVSDVTDDSPQHSYDDQPRFFDKRHSLPDDASRVFNVQRPGQAHLTRKLTERAPAPRHHDIDRTRRRWAANPELYKEFERPRERIKPRAGGRGKSRDREKKVDFNFYNRRERRREADWEREREREHERRERDRDSERERRNRTRDAERERERSRRHTERHAERHTRKSSAQRPRSKPSDKVRRKTTTKASRREREPESHRRHTDVGRRPNPRDHRERHFHRR